MAQEEVTYTIPSQGGTGSKVDAVFTTSDVANADGSFTVTGATGTYQTLDSTGAVVNTDTITGVTPVGAYVGNDNELFISANPAASPIVTAGGISFTISNAPDSNDGNGNVNFYDGNGGNAGTAPLDVTPAMPPIYFESDLDNMTPANSVTEIAVTCFVSGTRILTARGQVAVESLVVGDLAITGSGEHRAIRWLGHRAVDCRRHPRPNEVMPVRIGAHAFGPGRPSRDLVVSPGHSICLDLFGEVLIPAGALVNGSTIVQEEADSVIYWHVELDSHDILLAEDMPTESYLEMGNRSFFAEDGVVSLDASPDAPTVSHADFCRPFHAAGALVEAVRSRLAARALQLGWSLEDQRFADLFLMVDGVRLDPQIRGLAARFTVPAAARDVWLVSGTSVPATISASPDLRALGVCIRTVAISDGFGAAVEIAGDDPRLCVGLHGVEQLGESPCRWTTGRARLPASLWDGMQSEFFLRIELAFAALPRWVAPAPVARFEMPERRTA